MEQQYGPQLIAAAFLAAAIIAGLILALLIKGRAAATAMARLAENERDLAIERERSSRLPTLERALEERGLDLDRLRAEKAFADTGLAGAHARLSEKAAATDLLQNRLLQTAETLETVQSAREALERRLGVLQETLDQERKQSGEKLKLLEEARQTMTEQFQLLANEALTRHGETFSKQNKEQIDTMLLPLREKLTEFQQNLQTAHVDSAKERATLGEQIRHLSEASARMTGETQNLTRALKGKAQTQGAWGEMILATILGKSGLREGEEYSTQISHTAEDGSRLRPDVIVNLPGRQHVIIDAKVSLVAFEAHVNAETEEQRHLHLRQHADSLRKHIRLLGNKEYQTLAGGELDYVVMFVPIEGALAAGLQHDPELTNFAAQNKVAIATPTTLMIALRTIDSVWRVERRNRNAEEIAARAGRLYSKFVGFTGDLVKLGGSLDKAQASYQDAMGKLTTGKGNLLRQVEDLKKMGAKTPHSLPGNLIGDGEEETAPEPLPALAIGEAAMEMEQA